MAVLPCLQRKNVALSNLTERYDSRHDWLSNVLGADHICLRCRDAFETCSVNCESPSEGACGFWDIGVTEPYDQWSWYLVVPNRLAELREHLSVFDATMSVPDTEVVL